MKEEETGEMSELFCGMRVTSSFFNKIQKLEGLEGFVFTLNRGHYER